MRIADLIRKKLNESPQGALTSDIASYCLQNGAQFNTYDIPKSVSGQLSKMREAGYITFIPVGKEYIWKLASYTNDPWYISDNLSQEVSYMENYNQQESITNVKSKIEIIGNLGHLDFSYYTIICTVKNNDSKARRIKIKALFYDENKVPISVEESSDKIIQPNDIEKYKIMETESFISKRIKSYDLVIKQN